MMTETDVYKRQAYTMRIAPFDGFVIPRSGSTVYHYMYPAGQGDWQAAFAPVSYTHLDVYKRQVKEDLK